MGMVGFTAKQVGSILLSCYLFYGGMTILLSILSISFSLINQVVEMIGYR